MLVEPLEPWNGGLPRESSEGLELSRAQLRVCRKPLLELTSQLPEVVVGEPTDAGDVVYLSGMFEQVDVGGRPLKVPAICPKLAHEPGATVWPGPELGEHTREVLAGELGKSDAEIARLVESGAVGAC